MAFSDNPQFGITMFPTDYSIQPVELARAVEERGLDSMFFPEHTHIPASRATPGAGFDVAHRRFTASSRINL